MTYRKIDYLEWARTFMGNVRYDLARSNIKTLGREELGFTAEHVDIGLCDEAGYPALRELIARRYNVDAARVHITNGATAGITMAYAAVIQQGDEVLLESPNYEPLYRNAVHLGGTVKMLERTFDKGWQVDLEEIERKISRHTRAVILTNCHNPSGVLTSPEKLLTIGQIARDHHARVIVSEVYLDNLFAGEPMPCTAHGDAMIAIGSMSKVYGLGGLRIGWIVAAEPVIEKVKLISDFVAGGISTPSQSLALHALRNRERLIDRCRRIVTGNVKILREWIDTRDDLDWVEPDGGTVALVKLPPKMDASGLSNYLRERYSTLVVPGDFFWLKGFIRIALGIDEAALRAGLKHLHQAIDEFKTLRP